jgi:predicted nucleic acid-binding protein
LFEAFNRGDVLLAVPAFAFYEIASNILRASRQKRLGEDAAFAAIELLFYLGLATVDPPVRSLIPAAFVTAHEQSGDCGLYDAIFLVFSSSINAPLITADRPLFNAARARFDIVWIADLGPL